MKSHLINRFAWLCLLSLTAQQIISASSNYWLVSLQEAARSSQPIKGLLLALFATWLIPYLPGSLAVFFRTLWTQKIVRNFSKNFAEANLGNLSLYSDRKAKDHALQILSNDGISVLEEGTYYYLQLATASLNIACNVIAFSLLIDWRFFLALSFSIFLALAIIRAQNPQQVAMFKRAQLERVGLGQLLLASSDNVLLGNRYNYRQWWRAYSKGITRSMDCQLHAVVFRELVGITSALVMYVPCSALVMWIVTTRQWETDLVCDLLALTPRLAFVLSYSYYLTFLISQWQQLHSRLQVTFDILQPATCDVRRKLEGRIHWAAISATSSDGECAPQHLKGWEEIARGRPGRWTLRGENGAGKSTLLLLLKFRLGDLAYYLPPKNQLRFRSARRDQSTGQGVIAQIEELCDHQPAQIYLLDEWDANLDAQKMLQVSSLIDQLAQRGCVIEVRHRQ